MIGNLSGKKRKLGIECLDCDILLSFASLARLFAKFPTLLCCCRQHATVRYEDLLPQNVALNLTSCRRTPYILRTETGTGTVNGLDVAV